MNIKIRDATSTDVMGMYAVDHLAVDEGNRRQHIREWVSAGQAIVAVVDDEVVGYAALHYTFFGCGFIAMVMVDQESRRKGVATALIARLEKTCRTDKLFTSTNASNERMQKLLKRLSYEASGIVYNLDQGDPELIFFKNLKRTR